MDIWDDKRLNEEEFEFLPLDNIGTPTIFKVKDWNKVADHTFFNDEGIKFTRKYLHTSEGLLALSSIRLRRLLKPFAKSKEKGDLVIQRWCDGKDTRSTTYKVEKDPVEITAKKPKTTLRKAKTQ